MEIFNLKNFLILLLFAFIYFTVNKTMEQVLRRHRNLTNIFLSNALKVFTVIVGVFVFLYQYETFKDLLKLLMTNSAILVAVVGFTLQNSIKNVIAGTLLLSSETFKVGDRIRIPSEDISGVIEELTLRHTRIKLATSERAIVPNYLLNDSVVINNNLHNEETCYPLVVPVSNTSDIDKAKAIIEEVIQNHPDVIKKDESRTIATSLTTTSIELHTMVWTSNMEKSFRVISELRLEIIKEFQDEGIY